MIDIESNEVSELRALFADLVADPNFTSRPTDIPGDLRVAWRLSVLCLLVRRGRANTLALEHLHVLWWAIRSAATRSLMLRWLNGEGRPDELLIRFDPSLTVTVDLAVGAALVEVQGNGAVRLTIDGLAFANALDSDSEALHVEKAFLSELPSRISQRQIQELLEWK